MPEPVSALLEKDEKKIEAPKLSKEEVGYLGNLKKKLTKAKEERDTTHAFFDGMTYAQRCEQNRRLATSHIVPKENRNEVNYTTGTSRQKLMTQLAYTNTMNLQPDITAFDEQSRVAADLGEAVENILDKSRELDNDEEKMLRRQYTLLEQGEVFVEVIWKKGYFLKKTLSKAFKGQFREVVINSRLKKALDRLVTNIIRNEKVYLGDITKFDMDQQPFVFTIDSEPYSELKKTFGDWEMWKHVSEDLKAFNDAPESESNYSMWQMASHKKGNCEVLKYQSECDNEFQILINGVPMLPIGFPLEEVSPAGKYMVVKQVLEIIDEHFTYGKGLMQRLKLSQGMEDSFWRLALLKGLQSFNPPMVNNTGRVLNSSVFTPGRFTSNIAEGKLRPLLDQVSGISNGEASILAMLRDNIEDNSTDPQASGKNPKGDPTATQIQTVQLQAEKLLGLVVFVSALLEKKITVLGIDYVLKNWFDPVDTKVNEVRDGLANIYRSISVEKPIDGKGMGEEVVRIEEAGSMPSPYQVYDEQQKLSKESGVPTRLIVLNRDQILAHRWLWRVSVLPSPKKSTSLQKMMFQDKVNVYSTSPNFSLDWFEENAATTWGDNPQKVFARPNPMMAQGMTPPGASGMSAANVPGAPAEAAKRPSPMGGGGYGQQ